MSKLRKAADKVQRLHLDDKRRMPHTCSSGCFGREGASRCQRCWADMAFDSAMEDLRAALAENPVSKLREALERLKRVAPELHEANEHLEAFSNCGYPDCQEIKRAVAALDENPPAAAIGAARELVDRQAEDEGLWFRAETAAEAYLQQELRKLHAAVEADPPAAAGERGTDIEESHRWQAAAAGHCPKCPGDINNPMSPGPCPGILAAQPAVSEAEAHEAAEITETLSVMVHSRHSGNRSVHWNDCMVPHCWDAKKSIKFLRALAARLRGEGPAVSEEDARLIDDLLSWRDENCPQLFIDKGRALAARLRGEGK